MIITPPKRNNCLPACPIRNQPKPTQPNPTQSMMKMNVIFLSMWCMVLLISSCDTLKCFLNVAMEGKEALGVADGCPTISNTSHRHVCVATGVIDVSQTETTNTYTRSCRTKHTCTPVYNKRTEVGVKGKGTLVISFKSVRCCESDGCNEKMAIVSVPSLGYWNTVPLSFLLLCTILTSLCVHRV